MSILLVLTVIAFICAIIAFSGQIPVTVAAFLLALIELIRVWPLK
jgi:hypothetical protein